MKIQISKLKSTEAKIKLIKLTDEETQRPTEKEHMHTFAGKATKSA